MLASTLRVVLIIASLGLLPQAVLGQELNARVVQFCQAHIGAKVGDGQCSALAYYALQAAGAKDLNDFKNFPAEGDYVWGKHVYTVTARRGRAAQNPVGGHRIRPGDVVQYRNATFKGKVNGKPYSFDYGHHTAVVVRMNPRTGVMVVLEQNVNGKQIVQQGTIRLQDLRSGWFRVYRPVRKGH
jgi:hypothetical protein